MTTKPICFALLLLFCIGGIRAQQRWPLEVSIFDNATLLPGGAKLGIIGVPVHPGFSAGTEWRYGHHPKNIFSQTGHLAYQYHQYVQHSIALYSAFGYRRQMQRWDAGARVGVGYLQAIPASGWFEQNGDGAYVKKKSIGRPQFMATTALGVGCRVAGAPEAPVRVFVAYQFYLQMPFSPGYIPLLPNTALHLGFSFPLLKK